MPLMSDRSDPRHGNGTYAVTPKGEQMLHRSATPISQPAVEGLVRLDGLLTLAQIQQDMGRPLPIPFLHKGQESGIGVGPGRKTVVAGLARELPQRCQ